jgi:3-oxoacyl-[acyl-carrier protein] reductase
MLLEDKNAVIYGAGGSIGGAVAQAFAREGTKVFLAGRPRRSAPAGGVAETAQLNALDEQAVDECADAVAEKAGGIDVSSNAVWIRGDLQGNPLIQIPCGGLTLPI